MPGLPYALAAGARDFCMPDLMKIGGVTGWLRAMGQAEAAAVPVSSHLFVEASAHVPPVTPLAHYLEYLDLAAAVLADPPLPMDGCVTARGPGLGMACSAALSVSRSRVPLGSGTPAPPPDWSCGWSTCRAR